MTPFPLAACSRFRQIGIFTPSPLSSWDRLPLSFSFSSDHSPLAASTISHGVGVLSLDIRIFLFLRGSFPSPPTGTQKKQSVSPLRGNLEALASSAVKHGAEGALSLCPRAAFLSAPPGGVPIPFFIYPLSFFLRRTPPSSPAGGNGFPS